VWRERKGGREAERNEGKGKGERKRILFTFS
jgi:hypothetical protein